MPDQKISQLTAATTPLAGTETVPLVQGGANVKATVQDIANLAGGSSLSGITITPTGGTFNIQPFVNIVPAQYFQTEYVTIPAEGKWASTIDLYPSANVNQGITGVTFPDLTGFITGLSLISGMTTLSFPALKYAPQDLYSTGAVNISAPELLLVNSNISINNSNITSASFPKLKFMRGNFSVSNATNLTTISMPELKQCGQLSIAGPLTNLTTLDFSNLEKLTSSFSLSPDGGNIGVASVSFPALKYINNTIQSILNQKAISFPVIEQIGRQTNSSNIINISNASSSGNVCSFTLGSTLKRVGGTGGNVNANPNGYLNEASVDNILIRLAALDGTNGTTAFSNRIVDLGGNNSAPSAAGLTAKATLVARGCTVTTN